MHELLIAVASTISDFLNIIDWAKASDFMSFVNNSIDTFFTVARVSDKEDNKKGE